MPNDYTDAQLSDGTILRFNGQLNPDQVRAKVADYRAKQPGIDAQMPKGPIAPQPINQQNMQATAPNRFVTSLLGLPQGTTPGGFLAKSKQELTNPSVAWQDLRSSVEGMVRGLNPATGAQTGLNTMQQPGTANKLAGAVQYAASGIPLVGNQLVGSMEQARTGDVAGSMAFPAQVAVGLLSDPQVRADLGETAANAIRKPIRRIAGAGAGPESVARAAVDQENQAALAKYRDTAAQIKETNAQISQGMAAGDAAKAATATVSKALPDLAKAMKASAKAAYPDIPGEVDSAEIHSAMLKVIDDKLLGSGSVPSSLSRIISDTKPGPSALDQASVFRGSAESAAAQGFLKQTSGSRYGNLGLSELAKRQLAELAQSPEGATAPESGGALTFSDLHGMYSELGREAFSRDLPGDSKAALVSARRVLLSKMEDMASSARKLTDFRDAQRGWQVYENTFENTKAPALGGSPIARALRARDPITGELRPDYVQSILTESKSYKTAQQLLSNYPDAKDLQASLQLIKENSEAAKAAPKVSRFKPNPAPPQLRTFDVQKWREAQLQKYAIGGERLRAWDFMPWRLKYTIIQHNLAKILSNPAVRKAISR